MINELYDLSKALDSVQIRTQSWHRKYKPIPNIRGDAPCVRIIISNGKVVGISQLDAKFDKILRKYGSNQGSYPCMNLAPLYRIADESIKEELTDFIKHPERIDDAIVNKMKAWCTNNNWSTKFHGKFKISMEKVPVELQNVATQYEPLKILMDETNHFTDASILHCELERVAWQMIESGKNVRLALIVLFYSKSKKKSAEDDYGSISVAFESQKLIDNGLPAISEKFVFEVNRHLLEREVLKHRQDTNDSVDAFGIPFQSIEEPMPSIKLAGGFDVTIRTMFKDQRCQSRYGRIENAGYPISPSMRTQLASALGWAGNATQKNITWINTDRNEVLLAYPLRLSDVPVSYTAMFKRSDNRASAFSEKAQQFIQELQQTKAVGTDSKSKQIRVFVLRKIDKARTKVIYTRLTDADELEKCSEDWTRGCANLPVFNFGTPKTPYPLDVADVLNRFWKQNGEVATDKFKPFPKYHGLELLMEPDLSVTSDLHRVAESAMNIGPFLGNLCAKSEDNHSIFEKTKDTLAILGLFLNRKHIGKDQYMENLPYLYGQLLKAADELHALYCTVVRNGDFPPQLVGSSLFPSAAEAPTRTMQLLSQRFMPYYSWAKSYRLKKITDPGKESWRAGWLYGLCEKIIAKLQESWTSQTRFNDEEKAQLFIGYLAAFPKKEQVEKNIEEESVHE